MPKTAGARPRVRGGRDAVLAAAVDNFTRLGFHGTSMRDIARDAGVTVASIYHHFPSKQELLQEIMVRVLTDVIAATRSAVLSAGPRPTDQLAGVVEAWILFHTDRRPEALIGASEIRSLDDRGRRVVVALRDEQERLFRDVVDRGVAEGEFATAYPREAVRAIINMGYSVAGWYHPAGGLPPSEMARRYVTLALGAVRSTDQPFGPGGRPAVGSDAREGASIY